MNDGIVEKHISFVSKNKFKPYVVRLNIDGIKHYGTFTTLLQARQFRDAVRKPLICYICGTSIHRGNFCKECRNGTQPSLYTIFKDKLINVEDIKEGISNTLLVKCYKCDKWFNPTYGQTQSRVDAINGKTNGQHNLYCSQLCKDDCDVFAQKTRYKHQIPLHIKARCNQHINRQVLLDSQLDQYGYTFCEKCGTKTNKLAIHHNIMVSKDHTETDNMAHQLLVCNKCHTHEGC